MPTNIEIKARVQDRAALEARASEVTEQPPQIIPQVDTFFATANGRLKLRELAPDRGQLVYYERADQDGPKRSDYRIIETRDVAPLRELLTRALGLRGVVRKTRWLYQIGQTRLHLDEVEGLGHFMELEVVLLPGQSEADGMAIANDLMDRLGVRPDDLLEGAYMDLLEQGGQDSTRSHNAKGEID